MARKFNGACDTCAAPLISDSDFTTGYGRDDLARRHCYACCAAHDLAHMRATGRATLYLTRRGVGPNTITNWPGSLSFPARQVRRSESSAYGRRIPRYDAWFALDGFLWHCVNKGDMDIARCRRTKQTAY